MSKGETVSFGELSERARANGETVVGYVTPNQRSLVITNREEKVNSDDVKSLVVLTGKRSNSRSSS